MAIIRARAFILPTGALAVTIAAFAAVRRAIVPILEARIASNAGAVSALAER